MNHTGGVTFQVNETCLSCDHKAFMVAPSDKDAHNPILIHFAPSNISWNEQLSYIPYGRKVERKQRRKFRKERQKSNKRKACQAEQEEDEGDEGLW